MGIVRGKNRSPGQIGQYMENRACRHLERLGYRLIERNFRSRYGEIDVVAWEGSTLVFVEIRFRGKGSLVSPFESVSREKQRRIRLAVRDYLGTHKISESVPVRLDVCGMGEIRSFPGSGLFQPGEPPIQVLRGVIEFG